MNLETVFHEDGTITYWSVYNQVWVKRAWSVPDEELAAMSEEERERVTQHLAQLAIEHLTQIANEYE